MTAPSAPTAVHIGRVGEVAGGMTQVINGYLRWSFPRYAQRAIRSRDGSRGIRALRLFVAAWREIGRVEGPSVVVVHLSQRGSFIREGLLLRRSARRGLATVAQLHGSEFANFAAAHPTLVRSVLRDAHVVGALSEESLASVRALLPGKRVHLVPNAVEAAAPHDDSGAPTRTRERSVVFGGAVTRRKGVDVLLTAWARLAEDAEGWTLQLAGPHLEPELLDALPENVVAPGAIDHATLVDWLGAASIAVLPSRHEAMPMFLLEAMAAGTPTVSTRVGGIEALMEGGAGIVIEPGSVEALEQALRELMRSPERRAEVARLASGRWNELYSPNAVAPRLEAMWDEAQAMSGERG